MDIPSFIEEIINGVGGFKVQEDREFVIYPDREVGVAGFIIRCLANPQCKGSQEVLDAIIARRAKVGGLPNPPVDEPHLRPVRELIRVKAEAYEYRIYELEIAYMMQEPDTPESQAAWDSAERVKANYHRDYPDRPLNPKPRPDAVPSGWAASKGPIGSGEAASLRDKKPRKPYTRREKPAASSSAAA